MTSKSHIIIKHYTKQISNAQTGFEKFKNSDLVSKENILGQLSISFIPCRIFSSIFSRCKNCFPGIEILIFSVKSDVSPINFEKANVNFIGPYSGVEFFSDKCEECGNSWECVADSIFSARR